MSAYTVDHLMSASMKQALCRCFHIVSWKTHNCTNWVWSEWIATHNPTPAFFAFGSVLLDLFSSSISVLCLQLQGGEQYSLVGFMVSAGRHFFSYIIQKSHPNLQLVCFYGFCGGKSQLISTLPWSCDFHYHTSLHFLVSIRTENNVPELRESLFSECFPLLGGAVARHLADEVKKLIRPLAIY